MPIFNYQGRDSSGKLISGSDEAENPTLLLDRLRNQGYFVFEVKKKRERIFSLRLFSRKRRVKFGELIIFCREFATMVDAGLSILHSLNLLIEQTETKALRETLIRIRDGIEEGKSFSAALGEEPQSFSPLFINSVKSGEIGGSLDQVLEKLALYLEEQNELRNKVKSALFYPLVMVLMATALVTFLTSFVLPKFAIIFEEANVALPLPTLILMGISKFLRHYWLIVLLAGFGLLFFLRFYLRSNKGKRQFDWAKLKLPILGKFFQKTLAAQFSSTMEMLIISGVSLLDALRMVKEVLNNEVARDSLGRVIIGITAGKSFSRLLGEEKLFPQMVSQMCLIGEESGKLEDMLRKISQFFTREVGYSINRLTALIEPIILIFLGGIVLLLASSIILPIFGLIKVVQGG